VDITALTRAAIEGHGAASGKLRLQRRLRAGRRRPASDHTCGERRGHHRNSDENEQSYDRPVDDAQIAQDETPSFDW
jgi:hypothetical protein